MGLKARPRSVAVDSHAAYIAKVEDGRRADIQDLHDLVRRLVPNLEPTMMSGMMGYGPIDYQYASGRTGQWVKLAIANQKNYISLYCCAADQDGYIAERFRDRLPKANIGKSCVRFKRLSDLDPKALAELIRASARAGWGQ